MHFYKIYSKGLNDIFTWSSPNKLNLGDRVVVPFRRQKKIGIVYQVAEEPKDFKSRDILKVLNSQYIPPQYLSLATEVAAVNFTSPEKILNLIIHDKIMTEEDPIKKEQFYQIITPIQDQKEDFTNKISKLRGIRQKKVITHLKEAKTQISAEIIEKIAPKVTLKNLINQGLISTSTTGIKKIKAAEKLVRENNFDLTPLQTEAFKSIQNSKIPNLLFGVTGSGKTEIYKKLAKTITQEDETAQVLFLLPEIALTTQLIAEFRNIFQDKIALWHSNLSTSEKTQEWARVQSGEAKILIGARSAIFLPLQNPKLIILDEEHEWTYKNEFSPRFWTHDIALKIAKKFKSKLIFGSATPRLESLHNCTEKKWNRVNLPERVFATKLPKVQLIDLSTEAQKGNYHPVSPQLKESIKQILHKKKQVVIFLNKRGYSGSTMCKACGYTFDCPKCERPMKAHHGKNHVDTLICHICGDFKPLPNQCPSCQTKKFEFRGWGTQQVEDELQKIFPEARIARADADSITKKHDFENLMNDFSSHKFDILLGTQMIAKGLDFEKVELVGVILADVGLNLPDFRSEERVFQLLTQVSGRAGRRKKQGKIIVQTFNKQETIFNYVKNHDTEGFLNWQQEIREKMNMPPFSNLIKITFSHEKKDQAFVLAKSFFLKVKKSNFQVNFTPAFFPKMHNKYFFHCIFKTNDLPSFRKYIKTIEIPANAKIDINPATAL